MLKRGIIVVAVVAAALIAGTVWLLTRSDDSGYATPEEAVLKTCHADPANPPHNYVQNPPVGSSAISLGNMAVVGWTMSGEATDTETALVIKTGGGKWRVSQCKWRFTHSGN